MVRNYTSQEAVRRFRGAPGTEVKVQIIRNGMMKPQDVTFKLARPDAQPVAAHMLEPGYAYIRVRTFTDDTPGQLAEAIKSLKRQPEGVKGVILDLRNNARGSLEQAVRSASVLLGEQDVVTTKGRNPKLAEKFRGKGRELAFTPPLPLVALVDQGTARAAEVLAGALRDHKVGTLLGNKTLGLCGLTRTFSLQDGSAIIMTVAQCYTPKGDKISGKGLEPEVQAPEPPARAEAKEAPWPLPLDQDPWVKQALGVLKGDKPKQVAEKAK
jgi:carboxyl-terminal processing protease